MKVHMLEMDFGKLMLKAVVLLWVPQCGLGLPLPEGSQGRSEPGEDVQGLTGCQVDLEGQIQDCLRPIEGTFARYNTATEDVRRSILRRMCREYWSSLQCLHLTLLSCTPASYHLNLIATGVGDMREFMDSSCHGPMEEEEEEEVITTTTEAPTTTTQNTVKNTPRTEQIEGGYSFTISLTNKPVSTTRILAEAEGDSHQLQLQRDDPSVHGQGGGDLNRGPSYKTSPTTPMPDLKTQAELHSDKNPNFVAVKSELLSKNKELVDFFYNSSNPIRSSSTVMCTVTMFLLFKQLFL